MIIERSLYIETESQHGIVFENIDNYLVVYGFWYDEQYGYGWIVDYPLGSAKINHPCQLDRMKNL